MFCFQVHSPTKTEFFTGNKQTFVIRRNCVSVIIWRLELLDKLVGKWNELDIFPQGHF